MTATLTTTQIAAALRQRVLRLTPEDLGINRMADCPRIWGVVIETAHPDAVASLVVLVDGSVSLYVSDGNGCIGCGSNREIRDAAADLLQLAARTLSLATPSSDLELPAEGYIRCYLLTQMGLYAMQTKLEDINRIDADIGVLYFAAQRIVTAIERVGAGQSLAQEMKMAITALEHGEKSAENIQTGSFKLNDESSGSSSSQGAVQCLSVGNVVRRLRT